MRGFLIVVVLFLPACASSTKDLIEKADKTGDWTAVNRRLDSETKRQLFLDKPCGDGQVLMCTSSCKCVSNQAARSTVNQMNGNIFGVSAQRTSTR